MERSLRPRASTESLPLDVEEAMRGVETTLERVTQSEEPLLTRMVRELLRAGGKRLRPRITILAFAACGGTRLDEIVAAATAVELIHTASLVHDDIIDQSPLRRGRPTMHTRYGTPHAIVAGDFLFTQGFALSAMLPKEVIAVTARSCGRLAEGELMEQRLVEEDVDEAAYLQIIGKKTAEPIRAAATGGALLAGAEKGLADEMGRYGFDLGLAFQIADDVLDVAGDPAETGKAVGQDAKTGVLTMPLGLFGAAVLDIAALKEGVVTQDLRTVRRLAREMEPAELRARLEASGAIERARDKARGYADAAKARLDVLPPSPYRDALARLADGAAMRRA